MNTETQYTISTKLVMYHLLAAMVSAMLTLGSIKAMDTAPKVSTVGK